MENNVKEEWFDLCFNPYGDKVQENKKGIRRVEIKGGWAVEDHVEPFKVCRASNKEFIAMAASAMAVPLISASFKNKASLCYIIWLTPKNTPSNLTKENQINVEKSENRLWVYFQLLVKQSLGDRGIRAWAEKKGWDGTLVKWELFANIPNQTFNRGVQIGIARAIEKRKEKWVEMGLVSSMDSSLWRMPVDKKKILAKEVNYNFISPLATLTDTWPEFPQLNIKKDVAESKKVGGFNPNGIKTIKIEEEKEDNGKDINSGTWMLDSNICRLLWCTTKSLAIWGRKGLDKWFKWMSENGKGAIVFDKIDTPEQHYLFKALKFNKTNYQRWIIKSRKDNSFKCVIWWINIFPSNTNQKEIYWETMIGEQPEPKETIEFIQEDEFGRVPYRSLSKISQAQGMAPRRLEQNMHLALKELSKKYKKIDTTIAKALGITLSQLNERLTSEQVDAIALGVEAMETNSGLILADETGFGKGRILASIALIGLRKKKSVLMFTENAQLFSDFYRDLLAVGQEQAPVPALLHQAAVIVDPDGNQVTKSLNGEKFISMLKEPNWAKTEDKIILSTYAQINRAGEDQLKLNWLISRVKGNGWLLLDEAHNAAGESNVSTNLKKIIANTEGVIYSSATFAKTEVNLALYEKSLPVDKITFAMLEKSMIGDTGDLREALTTAMAISGRYIRREHPPVAPPAPIWVEIDDEKRNYINAFSNMWQCIFEASEAWEVANENFSGLAWLKVGAALSRSVKEFSMLMKLDSLVSEIYEMVSKDEKVVVVVASTFEAALKDVLAGQVSDEESEAPDTVILDESDSESKTKTKKKKERMEELEIIPLWKHRWLMLLDTVAPQNFVEFNTPEVEKAQITFNKAVEAINQLPDWDLSPLDMIKYKLEKLGIDSGELSGRGTALIRQNGSVFVGPRPTKSRIELVRDFNSGVIDVIFVTRAGCSGISLHAGKTFSDQRVRNLIEWDIAANPANRIQFWGRVRRRDQVIEPHFWGMALKTLFEKRTLAREDRKRENLAAHVGKKQHNKELSWLTPEGEMLIAEWAIARPKIAKRLGVFNAVKDNPIGRIDRALLRAIILPEEEQEALLSRIERGIHLMNDVAWLDRLDPVNKVSRVIRRDFWWGDSHRVEENNSGNSGALSMPRLEVVERIWENDSKTDTDKLIKYFHKCKNDKNAEYYSGLNVLSRWSESWKIETQMGVEKTPNREKVWNWVSKKLPLVKLGNAIQVSKPGNGEATLGIILGVDAPDVEYRVDAASAWDLSQVAIEVWLVGDNDPILIPLSRCFSDQQFLLTGKPASISWFTAPPVATRAVSIEGNPVIAAAWGKKWGVGRAMLVNDYDRGMIWIWSMPKMWNWNVMLSLPRDLIDVEHAMNFWKVNRGESLSLSLPPNMSMEAQADEKGLILTFDYAAYKDAKDSWLGFPQDRLLSYPEKKNGKVIRKISWAECRKILYAIEAAGLNWRCDSKFKEWYEFSSRVRIAALESSTLPKPKKSKSGGNKGKNFTKK